ncbi:zeta toxin family protein [Lactococcus muris]|uniref:UDP-N-acetylglucosamine kinase n=1 Tax=Lactococcus muris TaxID=2941330 RepID=A0ABV4D7X5_9LACT|nr:MULTISPECIES: zeta toxin family protein [Lactococcus]
MGEQFDVHLDYAKTHKNQLISDIVANKKRLEDKTAVFMAGSPGAGKSEVAASVASIYPDYVVIDADYFRSKFPSYNGKNSSEFQKAASWLVEQAFKYMIEHGYSFILDATFALRSSNNNIKRALKNNFKTLIFYVYQEPLIAWDFTKKREEVEGRVVPKSTFVHAFFKARENIIKAKAKYPDIELNIVLKDFNNDVADVHFDAENVELILTQNYTHEELEEKLND